MNMDEASAAPGRHCCSEPPMQLWGAPAFRDGPHVSVCELDHPALAREWQLTHVVGDLRADAELRKGDCQEPKNPIVSPLAARCLHKPHLRPVCSGGGNASATCDGNKAPRISQRWHAGSAVQPICPPLKTTGLRTREPAQRPAAWSQSTTHSPRVSSGTSIPQGYIDPHAMIERHASPPFRDRTGWGPALHLLRVPRRTMRPRPDTQDAAPLRAAGRFCV
jgi:hypothetical protein